jgi:ubiquinone/menaquinone biosynthesis C-methylase UbiE
VNQEQALRWSGESGRRWIAQRERHAAVRKRLLPHLWRAAALKPGDTVLDVGCGCGETTLAAAAQARRAVGLDISEPLLEVARASADGVSNVEFLHGDAQVYPLEAAGFDAVISSFGVMFFDDPDQAFANFFAALRPGGHLAFLCWQEAMRNEVFSIPLRAMGSTSEDPFHDPEFIRKLLRHTGFIGAEIEALHEPARIGSDVADVLEYQSQTQLARDADDAALAAMAIEYAARERHGGVWVEAAAWRVSARRP